MARIRTVKPEFWTHEALARCSRDARLLFVGLINVADDEGRMRAAPVYLHGQVFPYDEDLDITKLLDELEDGDHIRRYVDDEGQRFLFIPGFLIHQRIDHPAKSKLPPPPTKLLARDSRVPREDSRVPREKLAPDQGTGNREQGTGNREEETTTLSSNPEKAPACRTVAEIQAAKKQKAPPKPAKPEDSDFVRRVCKTWPWLDAGDVRAFEAASLEACPAINLAQTASAARAWELGQPKTKRKKAVLAFLGRWFAKAQTDADQRVTGSFPAKPRFSVPAEAPDGVPGVEETRARAERRRLAWEEDRRLHPTPLTNEQITTMFDAAQQAAAKEQATKDAAALEAAQKAAQREAQRNADRRRAMQQQAVEERAAQQVIQLVPGVGA